MGQHSVDADYLIIGSGAVGMAFADVLLKESNASIVMVDRHHRPGGHWNDAYPFVRLHGPSATYGVNSRKLGSDRKDATGLNKGLYELASGAEIVSYFDQVMTQQFIASGRVKYFPMSNYLGDKQFESLVSGAQHRVTVRKKIVDTTYMNVAVPATHPPQYSLAPGVQCVPLNELARIRQPHAGYVVIGSGKTGMDACLWLLGNGVAAQDIRWIMPRDAWLLDRAKIQPFEDFFEQSFGSFAQQLETVLQAASIEDLFARLEAAGALLRIDNSVEPTMYRCATVSLTELDELRRIKNVIRLGRVQRIDKDQIVLAHGTVPSDPDSLYIDCSACAFKQRAPLPVFDGDTITPQLVKMCETSFSAALIAHVELNYADDAEKNQLCTVVPLPERPRDWLTMMAANLANQYRWSKHEDLRIWRAQSRLDGFAAIARNVKETDLEKQGLLRRFGKSAGPATAKLLQFLAQADPPSPRTP